jgi:hypothetical protein
MFKESSRRSRKEKQQNLSVFIERLRKALDKHGDLPVYIENDWHYCSAVDYDVSVEKDELGEFILIA